MDKTVGKSDSRTPAKHRVLNAMLGREAGVVTLAAQRLQAPLDRLLWFDLTAGDGAVDGTGGLCSPLIFARHSLYRAHGRPVFAQLTEVAPNTYKALLRNLCDNLPHLRNRRSSKTTGYQQATETQWVATDRRSFFTASNMNGLDLDFSTFGRGDWLFINNDPNHVHDWALQCESVGAAVDRGARLCAMTTMGCNVGGLKQLPPEKREKWFENVSAMDAVTTRLATMDNLLVEIEGFLINDIKLRKDPAQWAYLLTRPYKWSVDTDTRSIAEIYRKQGLSVRMFSMRDQPRDYAECLDRLFLRHKERNNG